DLQVTNLVVPASAPHSGDTIPITWIVTNAGNLNTRENHWFDRVYLSSDPSLSDTAAEMGEIAHDTILKAGDSYTTTLNVRIPDGISGNFYVLVFSDANVRGAIDDFNLGPDGSGPMGRVQEFQGEGNNITAATLAVILRAAPKLQVAAVAAQGPDP